MGVLRTGLLCPLIRLYGMLQIRFWPIGWSRHLTMSSGFTTLSLAAPLCSRRLLTSPPGYWSQKYPATRFTLKPASSSPTCICVPELPLTRCSRPCFSAWCRTTRHSDWESTVQAMLRDTGRSLPTLRLGHTVLQLFYANLNLSCVPLVSLLRNVSTFMPTKSAAACMFFMLFPVCLSYTTTPRRLPNVAISSFTR